MNHIFAMKIDKRLNYLYSILPANSFSKSSITFTQVSYASSGEVLKINTEYIVFRNLTSEVSDYVFVIQLFKAIDFLLNCFHFGLVKTLKGMN